MIYKNVEWHNVAELIHEEDGSVSWRRVPQPVYDVLEADNGKRMARCATGVELRFVLKSDKAVIRMSVKEGLGHFHVYRGSVQGGWMDHEQDKVVTTQPKDYVIERSANMSQLKVITGKSGYAWDCEVIRIIFDRGYFSIFDIQGDVLPPTQAQRPKRTLLTYGSSITHGSNAIDMSHAWASVVAHNLKLDARNLGMAGSCAMEPAMVDYIASEGEKGNWDVATLELGINVITWEEPKILERVENTIRQIAGRNPDKPVFVISPFYYCGDDFDAEKHGNKWRRLIRRVVEQLNYPNVTYINGLDMIDNMSYMSADLVHPNIYGVQQIADRMTVRIKEVLTKY